jgi:hypothetical protein
MSDHYILDGKLPRKVDLMTWAEWYAKAYRHVADTMKGNIRVSTVFLGLDHQWGNGPPELFETVIFGCDKEWQERCSTWEEAEAMHKRACELAGIDEAK